MSEQARVILAILDGLRPDAITPAVMPVLHRVGESGWRTTASTVHPSVTVAALGSLATGVSPGVHGLREGKMPPLLGLGRLRALPAVLRAHGRRTVVVTGTLAPGPWLLARTLLGLAGVGDVLTAGPHPRAAGELALQLGRHRAPDLAVVYLNHCDVAGHREGWMSPGYLEAAQALDRAMEPLARAASDGGALLLVASDHGGGGIDPRDHDGTHPLNSAIPLIAAGHRLRSPAPPPADAHLLDIPPTILAALDVPIPASYEGRPLPLTRRMATAA